MLSKSRVKEQVARTLTVLGDNQDQRLKKLIKKKKIAFQKRKTLGGGPGLGGWRKRRGGGSWEHYRTDNEHLVFGRRGEKGKQPSERFQGGIRDNIVM